MCKKRLFQILNFFCIFRFAAEDIDISNTRYIPKGLITFDTEQVDASNVFDPSTGKFKVKREGLYVFSFSANIYDNKSGGVVMYINGGMKSQVYHSAFNKGTSRQINFVVSRFLDVGDVITFQNYYANSIYVTDSYPMTLVVYKIK